MSKHAPPDIRTAIVTGAASGIGAAEVGRLRSRGVSVLAVDLNADVGAVHGPDPGVVGVIADVTAPDDVGDLVARAEAEFGPVDLLFHAAGIMPGGKIGDTSSGRAQQVMATNYGGTVQVLEAVLPGMRQRGYGQVVVIGSLTGYVPTRGFSAYSASKAAVNSFVETLAREERRHGIQVLLAAPNAVKTPLLAQAADGPRMIANMAQKSSAPMLSTTDEVLDAIERGLSRGRAVVVPGGRLPYALRRLSPSVTWALTALMG